MINYRINILEALKIKGFNTTYLRNNRIFGESIIQKFRKYDTDISLKTVNTLLNLLECGFEDIFEFEKDEDLQSFLIMFQWVFMICLCDLYNLVDEYFDQNPV